MAPPKSVSYASAGAGELGLHRDREGDGEVRLHRAEVHRRERRSVMREREGREGEKNRTNQSFSTNQWYWWIILPQL
jgi:hypothetical protein